MTLLLDPERDLYVGESLSVSVEAFLTAVQILVERGANESKARRVLLGEECWSPEMDGVWDREGPRGPGAWLDSAVRDLNLVYVAQRLVVVALAAGIAFALVIVLTHV